MMGKVSGHALAWEVKETEISESSRVEKNVEREF